MIFDRKFWKGCGKEAGGELETKNARTVMEYNVVAVQTGTMGRVH